MSAISRYSAREQAKDFAYSRRIGNTSDENLLIIPLDEVFGFVGPDDSGGTIEFCFKFNGEPYLSAERELSFGKQSRDLDGWRNYMDSLNQLRSRYPTLALAAMFGITDNANRKPRKKLTVIFFPVVENDTGLGFKKYDAIPEVHAGDQHDENELIQETWIDPSNDHHDSFLAIDHFLLRNGK